jgi:uncharacterized protein
VRGSGGVNAGLLAFGAMGRAQKLRILAPAALLVLAACRNDATPNESFGHATVSITQGAASLTLSVEVAATSALRQRGLMRRRSVPNGTGMLFTYPSVDAWGGYWMKDTLVPLDVAFVRDGSIIEIDHMVPCTAEPCHQTIPAGEYDAVLEAPAGTFAAARITPGARLQRRAA